MPLASDFEPSNTLQMPNGSNLADRDAPMTAANGGASSSGALESSPQSFALAMLRGASSTNSLLALDSASSSYADSSSMSTFWIDVMGSDATSAAGGHTEPFFM